MTKALRTMTAATVALGLAAAVPTAAQAFVPAVAAAWLAGGVLGGAFLGSAVTNTATYPTVAAAPAGVTINSTTCYYTNRLVNPVTQQWIREQVCTTAVP
ncbi:MAG: hypothetical protein JO223_06290 [Hyphomicrobiales bacterium]|nr:hypothetical protein [Hyphomicrobiales bacterium]MBV8442513.1 hypothetical protein [Hyphomicrobiales bacterium]